MKIITGFVALALIGCKPVIPTYKMNVRQGNYVTEAMVKNLKPSMSKNSVQKIMGTAMLKHKFKPNQWDYYYSFISGDSSAKVEKRFTIFFQNEKLSHIEGDWEPKSSS